MIPPRNATPPQPLPALEHVDAVIRTCLHCGLCLPVCPTYALTLDERSSPRGRIRLIRSVMDRSLTPGRAFAGEMNFCLDCRACEPACPAGVKYGELVEYARTIVRDQKLESLPLRIKKWVVLRGVFGSAGRFALFFRLMKLYRVSGLREAVERSGILDVLPAGFRRLISSLPDVADTPFLGSAPEVVHAKGTRAGSVGLLTGCVMNVSFPAVHRETTGLLARSGFDVVIPPDQFCCGSLHGHNGDLEHARRLAARLIGAFPGGLDAVVVNSAGCGAFMKEYRNLFRDDPPMAERAAEFSGRVRDISEFLDAHRVTDGRSGTAQRVTYHEACHLVHAQRVSREPRALIASVPGVELVEMHDAAMCCGSAGIYNIIRPADSDELLRRKVAAIIATGAQAVVTGNPGCHLQIARGLRAAGAGVEVIHPVSLLCRGGCGEAP